MRGFLTIAALLAAGMGGGVPVAPTNALASRGDPHREKRIHGSVSGPSGTGEGVPIDGSGKGMTYPCVRGRKARRGRGRR